MLNLKTISVITLSMSLFAIASQASAQTSLQELKIAAHSTATVKSAPADPKALPKGITLRKIKRVVKPLPALATATQPAQAYLSHGVINAASSHQKPQTRFIYNRSAVETQMPVYFSEDALKSK